MGFGNQAVTLYNSEMALARYRGSMNFLFQVHLQPPPVLPALLTD